MRPLKLTISAWGPYPGKVSVDFSRFQEGSVFLVTGPTGAGKTTIFDAISYALYGNVSGSNREKTTVRSDFAVPEVDTFVELIFLHKGVTYQINRTPKYDRPKKRGDGFTTSAETAVLTIEGEAPIASVQDVNRKVEEIMGINYGQFKQIAMIAQGEFLSLLYAKSEDKVTIFRNLFQTQLYDTILKSLTERSKNLYVRIKEHTNKMDEAVASVDAGRNEELQDAVQMENKNYERIIELLKEVIHEDEGEARKLKKQSGETEEEYTKKLNEIAAATELNRNLEQLKKAREVLKELMAQKEDVEAAKVQIARARKAGQVEVHEKLYLESVTRNQAWNTKVSETEVVLEQVNLELVTLEQELVRSKELEASIEEVRHRIQWLESLLPLFRSLDEQEQKQKNMSLKLKADCEKELQIKALQTSLKDNKVKLTEQLKQYESVETKLGEIQLKILTAKQQYENLQQALKRLEVIRKEETELKSVQEKYLLEEEKLKVVKERYEGKERLYRQAAVGLAARYLEDNQPCPVCGSLEHPKKAVVSHEVPDEAQLEKEKKLLEQEQKVYNDIFNQASAMKGALESKKEEFERMTKELGITEQNALVAAFNQVKSESKELIAKRGCLEKQKEEKELFSKQLTECENRLEKTNAEFEKISDEKAKTQSEYDVLAGTVANLRLQLPKEYQETVKVELELKENQQKLQRFTQEVERIQKKKEQLYAKKESTQALLESHKAQVSASDEERKLNSVKFEQAMAEAGFYTKEEYESAKMTQEAIAAREQAVNQYVERLTASQEQEKQLALRTQGQTKAELEQMNEALRVIQEKRKEQQLQSETLTAKILCNRKAWESLKEKHAKIADLSETYGYIKDLENAAKGVNGERIVFEHYVLAAYFEEILAAANLRLAVMTNSRYELMKVSKVTDQRTKNSLDIEVLDQYTGKRRSVKTLSGGESFKAALSLALGLSDIIQRNAGGIEIDTLFIDEGFGSLDSESLDQALKTLTTLTGQNKLIGIISHVNELKERIDNQIVIEKDHSGSRLEVIC